LTLFKGEFVDWVWLAPQKLQEQESVAKESIEIGETDAMATETTQPPTLDQVVADLGPALQSIHGQPINAMETETTEPNARQMQSESESEGSEIEDDNEETDIDPE